MSELKHIRLINTDDISKLVLGYKDAKWLYDNCEVGTKVTIINKKGSDPFPKPTAYKLPSWHTWDPTDPNMQYKCKQNGCH